MTGTSVTQTRIGAKWLSNAKSFARGVGVGICGVIAPIASVWTGIHLGKAAFAATGSPKITIVAGLVGFIVPVFAGYMAMAPLVLSTRTARETGFMLVGLLSTVATACYVPNYVWDSFEPTREVREIVDRLHSPLNAPVQSLRP